MYTEKYLHIIRRFIWRQKLTNLAGF
jgi:hypothetical protein